MIFKKPISELLDEKWNAIPDFYNSWEDYQKRLPYLVLWKAQMLIGFQISKLKLKKAENWSIFKFLVDFRLFPGVGNYIRTEITVRLNKLYNIGPEEPIGPLIFTETSKRLNSLQFSVGTLMRLISIVRTFVGDGFTFIKHVDILKHNVKKLTHFWLRFIQGYRKPGIFIKLSFY